MLAELAGERERFAAQKILFSFFETHGFQSIKGVLSFLLLDIPRFFVAMCGDVNIVHFHVSVRGSFYRKYVLYLLARLFGKKAAFHLHAGNFERFVAGSGRAIRNAASRFARGADAAVAVSSAIGDEVSRYRGTRLGLYIIGNTARMAQTASHAIPLKDNRNTPPYIAFVGRLVEGKGIDDLMKALAILLDRGVHVGLKLAGGGDLDRWKRAASAHRVDRNVEFVGWLEGEEKLSLYRNARVFCMPSHFESFGISTLEAMFLGVPVVGTCVGGFLDLVEDGRTGYLVSPGDAESLADRIHILLDNPDLAVRMGVEAAERACTRYSVEKIADQYVCCYRNVMALPGGKR